MPRYINKGRGERPENGYSLTCDQTGCNVVIHKLGKKTVEYRMHAHKRKQHGIIDNSITYHLCNEELCTNRVFLSKADLIRHKSQVHKIIKKQELEKYKYTVKCTNCTKIFRNNYSCPKRDMLYHKKKVHGIEDPGCKFYVCRNGECGELLQYKYERNRHEKICNGKKTERKYKCNYCNECLPFVNIESLLQHIYYKHNNISRTNFQQHLLLKYLLLQRFVQEINTVPISDGPGKKKRKKRKNRKKRVKKKQKL